MKILYIFSVIIIAIYMVSCTNDIIESGKNLNEKAENPFVINQEEALQESIKFLEISQKAYLQEASFETRASINVFDESKTKIKKINRVIKSNINTKSVLEEVQEIPVYIFDFFNKNGDPAGYVVYAGDSRYKNKIFSFNFENSFKSLENEDKDFWIEAMDIFLYNNINKPETKATQAITYYGSNINVKWGQTHYKFLRYTPTLSNGTKGITGSISTAQAQIMSFHKWPRKGYYWRHLGGNNWNDIPTVYQESTWNSFNSGKAVADYTMHEEIVVSNLMAEIGNRNLSRYQLNGETTSTINNAQSCFEQMGYTVSFFNSFDADKVLESIRNNKPVLISGDNRQGNKNHSYAADMIMNDGSESWLKVRMGLDGNYDGYYQMDGFKRENAGSVKYPHEYRYSCKILHQITKNPNKDGASTMPSSKPIVE